MQGVAGLNLNIATLVELNYTFYMYNLLVLVVVAGLNYFDYLYYLYYASFQYALLDCIF